MKRAPHQYLPSQRYWLTDINSISFVAPLLRMVDDNPADSAYHYIPTEYVCVIFVGLYGLSTLIHLGQSIRYRMWWLLPTVVLAGLGEVLGWSARLWSSQNPPLSTPFLIQISTTIIAPTPLAAANFITLGMIINKLGNHYSRLSTRWYTIIFSSFDIISLVVQALGGGIASSAKDLNGANFGAHIMLGGIIFQLVSLIIYVVCAAEFFLRFLKDRPIRGNGPGHTSKGQPRRRRLMGTGIKIMIEGLTFSTICLLIRAVYRTIELADGWDGRIISTEVYFNVLDGAMVTLAMFTLNFAHPGVFLPEKRPSSKSSFLTYELV